MPGASKLAFLFTSRGSQVVVTFLLGICAYQLRTRIPYSAGIFVACCVISVLASVLLTKDQGEHPALRFLLLPTLVYITLFVGLTPMPLFKFFRTGDYSYGIYLYHSPFIQLVILLFPGLALAGAWGAVFSFALALPAVIVVAWLSWHFVEKPILAQRKRFSFVAKQRGVD